MSGHRGLLSGQGPDGKSGGSGEGIAVYPDETLEDLQRGNFRLIQKKDGFRYGEDAVLLAHYAARQVRPGSRQTVRCLELGSHCGIISILFQALCPRAVGLGVELFPRQVDVMARNIRLNRLEASLRALEGDIRNLASRHRPLPAGLQEAAFDLVICNPPYGVPARGFGGKAKTRLEEQVQSESGRAEEAALSYEKRAAREEVAVSFAEICRAAARLLKPQGRFVFSHRPDRLPELLVDLQTSDLAAKKMLAVQPQLERKPTTVLLTAVKHGRPGSFHFEAPLLVRDTNRQYTEQMRAFIGPTRAYEPSPGDPPVFAAK